MNAVEGIATDTIGLKLPSPMKAYLEAQATKCGCADVSEFVVSVLAAHQQRQVRSEIEAMLLERIDGPFAEWTDQDMEYIRKEGTALINLCKGK